MASLDITFPDDFLSGLLNADTSELCSELLNESGDILCDSMVNSLKSSIHGPSTGELVGSIKAKKPTKTSNGAYLLWVGPTGYSTTKYFYQKNKGKKAARKYPLTNAAKAIWLEYGNSKQTPAPFLDRTVTSCQTQVIEKMQSAYDARVNI